MILDTIKQEKQKFFMQRFMEKHKEIRWPYNISEKLLNIETFNFSPSFNVTYPNVEAILRSVDKKIISADVLSTFELNNICKNPELLARILSIKVMLDFLKETSLKSTIDKIFNTIAIYANLYDVHDTFENFLDYIEKNMVKNLSEVIEKSNKIVEYLDYPCPYETSKCLSIFNILKYRSNLDFSPNRLELILKETVGPTDNDYLYNCHNLLYISHLSSKVFDGVNEYGFLDLVDFIAVDDRLSEYRANWLRDIISDDSVIQYNLLETLSIFSKENLNTLRIFSNNETVKYLSEADTNQILTGQFLTAMELNVDMVDLPSQCESFREEYGEIAYEQYVINLMKKVEFRKLSTSQKNYLLKLPKDSADMSEDILKRYYRISEILIQHNDDDRSLIDLIAENNDLLDATVKSLETTDYKIIEEEGKILTSLVSKILDDKPSLETYSQFLEYLKGTNVNKETYEESVEKMRIRGNYFQNHNINDTFDKLNKNDNGEILPKLIHKCNDDLSLCQTINLLTNQDIDQDLLNSEILYLNGLDNKQYRQGIERITAINIINQSDDENIKSFIFRYNRKLSNKGIIKVKK